MSCELPAPLPVRARFTVAAETVTTPGSVSQKAAQVLGTGAAAKIV